MRACGLNRLPMTEGRILMIYNPIEYGAVADGRTVSTKAVQAAIDDCHKAGGGTVLLTGGRFVSGTIYLKSGIRLVIDRTAELVMSGNIGDYGEDTHYNRYVNETEMDRCFLFAQDAEQIEICGGGLIAGNAQAFPNPGSPYRPMMMRFLRCRGIHIRDLRLYDSPAWTTAFLDSEDIWAQDLDIRNDKRYNGDGLDFDGCRNVYVTRCKLYGTDDNLCLQAGENGVTENVHISDTRFSSVCAGIRIGLRSMGTISNVVIANCTFENVWREGVKIECTEGGTISRIIACGLVMKNVSRPVFVLLNNRLDRIGSSIELKEMPAIGTLEQVQFNGILVEDTEEMERTHLRFGKDVMGSPVFSGIRIDANRNHPIRDLSVIGLSYLAVGGVKKKEIPEEYPEVPDLRAEQARLRDGIPFISENYYPDWSRAAFMDIRGVDGLILSDISLRLRRPDERPPFVIEECRVKKQEIWVEG